MHPFDKYYFHGGSKVGGYAGSGYRDFPVHWITYRSVMKRKPESVLELGCARGYVLKRLSDYAEIPVLGLEISEHCHLTRATDAVVTCDVASDPWPVDDQSFDLCLSVAFLEHVPEEQLPHVFAEMARTCARGLHGIDVHDDDHFDKTHVSMHPLSWWQERLPPGHEAVDKEDLEAGPIVLPPDVEAGPFIMPPDLQRGVKLNLGSFTHMFHGWRNVDHVDLSAFAASNGYSFTQWDITRGLPYDDRVVDLIFLSHVLEHFDYATGQALLGECRRVLKPDGLIRIAVPDADRLIEKYEAGTLESLRELCGVELDAVPADERPIQLLHELLYGGDHRALYHPRALMRAAEAAGFTRVARHGFGASGSPVMQRETLDMFPELSVFVEARP